MFERVVHVCKCGVCVCVRACTRACACVFMPCVYACMCVCMHACTRTVRACNAVVSPACACVCHSCTRMCVCMSFMYACMCVCMPFVDACVPHESLSVRKVTSEYSVPLLQKHHKPVNIK